MVMELFAELAEWQREWRVFGVRDSLAREMERRYRLALSDAPDEVGRALAAAVAEFGHRAGVERITLRTFAANELAVEAWTALGFEPRIVQMTAPVGRLLGSDEPHRDGVG